jgi:pimeloyl-ACP methyl ester carboxylesterase
VNRSTRHHFRLTDGTRLAFVTAGKPSQPAVLLVHGFPGSADYFREIIPALSQVAYVIAPDLPGFGESEVLSKPTFRDFGRMISQLLDDLKVGKRYIYLHDFGAPPALDIAMQAPEQVLGLIVQNANAHRSGLGPPWSPVIDYWTRPNAENEAASTAHLTFDGVRNGYVGGMPPEVAARISPEVWEEDWRVMQLPGRMDTQRALVKDYGNHVARFDEIAQYLKQRQPPAVMFWARHDPFFDLEEVMSWMRDLPRMEVHVLDGGHKLLETHAASVVPVMLDFIHRTLR